MSDDAKSEGRGFESRCRTNFGRKLRDRRYLTLLGSLKAFALTMDPVSGFPSVDAPGPATKASRGRAGPGEGGQHHRRILAQKLGKRL